MAHSATRLMQDALSWAYRSARRTGIMNTRAGRGALELAYWAYKSRIEARDIDALRPYVPAGSTVIDVGANIGFFAMRFADWVGPAGRVIAIEPGEVNAASLRARVKRHGLEGRITVVEAAALEIPGRAFLHLNPDNPADHRVAESGEAIAAVSVDSVLETESPATVSLIKIDVQGTELRVVRGALRVIRRISPTLFVELHEESLAAAGTSSIELVAELRGLGYRPHVFAEGWKRVEDDALFAAMRERGYVDVLLLRGAQA